MAKRVIGGLVVAVVIALGMTQTVGAFYMQCSEFLGWDWCWPF